MVDEKAIVNAMIGLLATGGSTNHFIHLPAIARAAGIVIDWQDFAELSDAVPLIARVYPNGSKDVNDFQDAGGMAFVIYTLGREGLIHTDHLTAGADSMDAWVGNPELHGDELVWKGAEESADIDMLRPASDPFRADGGLRLVQGNIGRAVFKTSAVDEERWIVEAPARCFSDQNEVLDAFKAGELDRDCAVVVRFQGPRANGMPELHKLTPTLGVLQDRGYRVALITDGRMSGASGKVPAAIHVSPEALPDGPLARVRDGDVIRLDARAGTLEAVGVDLASRPPANSPPPPVGTGRELFAMMRMHCNEAEAGASAMLAAMEAEQFGSLGQDVRKIAVADVGGTHARFALAEIDAGRVGSVGEPVTLKTSEHGSFQLAWQEFGRRAGIELPNELAIAFAGPVGGELLKLTNNPWVIRPALIKERLGVDRYTVVNDFGAVAYAVATLGDEHFRHICGPERPLPKQGVISIVGPGTGLGVAALLRKTRRLRGDRDRGRPCRFRAARQPRGQYPRAAAAEFPPGVGGAGRGRARAAQPLRSARRHRQPRRHDPRRQGAVGGGAGGQGQPRNRGARPALPQPRRGCRATWRWRRAPSRW